MLSEISDCEPFFNFSRTTAWRLVKKVMHEAGINGDAHSMPKAFRHSFGIAHAQAKTPPHLMQRWFGHAKIETTHIYLDAVGDEERDFASSIWPSFQDI
jgi:site-specific recombinase XerD